MSVQNPDTTSGATAIEDKALDKESLIEFLGEDDVKPETLELEDSKKEKPKDTKEEKEEKPAEEKELSLEEELEEELKELEDPEKEEELDLVAPPSRKEILAKYPTIFKDFPHLQRAFYREQRYAEILPTIEDAKNAVEKANLFDRYEKEVMDGSTETFLSTVKDNDRETFNRVVDNYLPTLFKVDEGAYYHTIGNVAKHFIISMVKEGQAKNDEELSTAAAVFNNWLFNTTTFTQPTKLSKSDVNKDDPSSKKEQEVSQRERNLLERQFTTARDGLGTRVDNIIKSTVDKAIDPNESMTNKIRQSATREVLEGLEESIKRDTRFRAIYDKLWEKAFDSNFDAESMDRIKKAYLSKAKTLLPYLIKKTRSEFLKGNTRKAEDTDNTRDRKGHLPVGKVRSSTALTSGKPNGNSKPTIPKGMTTLEYLNSDD